MPAAGSTVEVLCKKCGLLRPHGVTRGRPRSACRECVRTYNARYHAKNREAGNARCRKYHADNAEKENERCRRYYSKARESEEFMRKNRERARAWKASERGKAHRRERYATDALYNVAAKARSRTSAAFARRGYSRGTKTETLLGCGWADLLSHLETKLYGGMTVEDLLSPRVHIDHIVPLCSAKTEEDLVALCHYTNLQPLWAEDNLSKSGKTCWTHPQEV